MPSAISVKGGDNTEDKTVIMIVALICLTIIELAAISQNIDGTILSGVVAVLAGVVGGGVGYRFGSKES